MQQVEILLRLSAFRGTSRSSLSTLQAEEGPEWSGCGERLHCPSINQ